MPPPLTQPRTANPTTLDHQAPQTTALAPWPGIVQAMTPQVIRIHVQRRYEPGTILVLKLENDRGTCLAALVRVDEVHPGEKEWRLACRFLQPVSAEELEAFLRGLPAPAR